MRTFNLCEQYVPTVINEHDSSKNTEKFRNKSTRVNSDSVY